MLSAATLCNKAKSLKDAETVYATEDARFISAMSTDQLNTT